MGGLESELRLKGWSQARRVVVLRRPLRQSVAEGEKKSKRKRAKQMTLDLVPEVVPGGDCRPRPTFTANR